MTIDQMVDWAAAQLGLTGLTLLVALMVLSKAANLAARLIPDDATGFKGALRKVCVVIGVYASSRVTSGVSTADVTKGLVNNGAQLLQRDAKGKFTSVKAVVDAAKE